MCWSFLKQKMKLRNRRMGEREKVPLTVLGNSSNVIIKDGGIRGIVMILTEMITWK